MISKKRIVPLGIGFAMLLACLGLLAPGAFAEDIEGRLAEWHSSSTSGTTFITGEQSVENVITLNGGTLKCKTARFSGSYGGTTDKELTVAPTIGNCTAFGQEETVAFNSCDYHFTQPTETVSAGEPTDLYHSVMHIRCTNPEDKIIFTVGDPTVTCKVEIGPQTPTGPLVDLTNNTAAGPKQDATMTWTLSGITYATSGGICGKGGANGRLTGTVKLKAYQNATHTELVDLWSA